MTKNELRKLTNEIKAYSEAFANEYCKEACKEITQMAKSAIEKFYDDYSPTRYYRTKNLMKRSYIPIDRVVENGVMYGGVLITSDNMFDNYNGTPEQVAWSGWHGWHGLPGMSEDGSWINPHPIYTTPPIEMVMAQMNSPSFRNRLRKHAEKEAESLGYKYLKFE